MVIDTAQYTVPDPNPTYEWSVSELSGGVNYEDLEYELKDNQSPKALNIWFNNHILSKRWGQENAVSFALGTPILAAYPYLYKGYFIFASGTELYKFDPSAQATYQIYTGLAAKAGAFFKYNQALYYINGAQFIQWDGTTASAVTPYIPTVIINRTPTGGGDVTEDYNRLGAGFTNEFNGTGSATAYTLTDSVLDATAVTATVNGTAMTEGSEFSVNRATGIVTFSSAPPAGQNNVIITAYKTVADDISSATSCTIAMPFGGNNDNRIFFSGNGTPYYYWSGVTDPSYWPLTQYNLIGANDDAVTAFGRQQDVLIIFKSRETYAVSYTYDTTVDKAYFSCVPVSAVIGCDCPNSVQVINNRLTWLTSYGGVYTLNSTIVHDQKDILPISRNINGNAARPGLMQESGLMGTTSVCFGGKYWLCVNGHVYLWDYEIAPYTITGQIDADAGNLSWWLFDNIDASAWMIDGTNLYYGNANGNVVHFIDNFRDFGTDPINGLWRMPLRDFGFPQYLKTILELWITARSDTKTKIALRYITNNSFDGDEDYQPIIAGTFAWSNFSWDAFSWQVINYMKTFRRRPNKKKILVFGVEFSNDETGHDLNVSGITLTYTKDKTIK